MLATGLAVIAYMLVLVLAATRAVPILGLLALGALPLLLKFADFEGKELSPPEYGARTTVAFLDSTLFTFLLAAGILLG